MLFLFILWAERYNLDDDDSYLTRDSRDEILGDDYDDFSSPSRSEQKTYSTKVQNYAKGKIPSILHHRLSELFSIAKTRQILGAPDILADLRRWQVSSLSTHDVYTRKDRAVHSAIENLCSLLKIKDPYFCDSNQTLIERIVTDTFHNMKSVVLGQLLQFIESTLKEDGSKLGTLKKKEISIKQQAPARKRKLLENKERAREEERRLDRKIHDLEVQLNKKYDYENDKKYDEEALADLKEQKSLLLIEPAHVHHDLDKQEQVLEKITKQKHLIQSDIEKFKGMAKELSDIMKERESSADLEDAWSEINIYFEKFEKAKQDDIRREEEKARKLADEKSQEENKEQQKQAKEMELLQGLSGKSSDPEAAKESAGWLDSIGKLISVGGK